MKTAGKTKSVIFAAVIFGAALETSYVEAGTNRGSSAKATVRSVDSIFDRKLGKGRVPRSSWTKLVKSFGSIYPPLKGWEYIRKGELRYLWVQRRGGAVAMGDEVVIPAGRILTYVNARFNLKGAVLLCETMVGSKTDTVIKRDQVRSPYTPRAAYGGVASLARAVMRRIPIR